MQTADLTSKLGDRYRIERELGRGGMGAVYLARDLRLDRLVALKVLPAEYASQPALRERFLRETRTAASFSHPNIVPVYAVEESDDLLAYAMAYVEGESLADRVKRAGPLPTREIVRLLQDTGYALAYAHGRGIVHRDIKPDNIMIERATGRALIMDFGIARVIAAPVAANDGLTRVGEVVGTPEYMSPEQATGDLVDGRSDLYSLGLVAFFAVTGTPAVSGGTTGKILARQITEAIPAVRGLRPDLPAPLAEAIDRCARKDPAERFQNAEALVDALDVAQLAAPEIPLAIRLLAQELSTLSLVLVGGFLVTYSLVRAAAGNLQQGNDDVLVPVIVIVAVLLTRTLQTLREVRRVAAAGFSPTEIHRQLASVVRERAAHREELRADPATQRARRRTWIAAVAQLVLAVIMWRAALALRYKMEDGNYHMTVPGSILGISAMIMFGVSLALLLRSPFRMPLGEALFRLVWLGPIGRAFVWFAGRGISRKAEIRGASAATSIQAVPVSIPASALPQLTALESRISELERWRASQG